MADHRSERFAEMHGLADSDAPLERKQAAAWRLRGPATGITLDDVRRMDLVELATFAVAHRLLSVVALELQRLPRPSNPAAGRVVVRAYRKGHATRHVTASLLALMPTEGGYEVAAEILRAARGARGAWGDGPLAADAMVVHDASAACPVLLELICDDTVNHGLRRPIALILNRLEDARIVPAICEAVRAGHIGPVLGGAAIQSHPIGMDRLVEWLGTEAGEVANLAFAVIRRGSLLDVTVVQAVLAAFDTGRLKLGNGERERVEQRWADLTGLQARAATIPKDPR
jgi:hypothetical protein